MSTTAETIQSTPAEVVGSAWSLWLRQIGAIMRLDLKRNFFGKRAVLIYLLALMPIGLLLMIAVLKPGDRDWLDFTQYPKIFSIIYNALILLTFIGSL
jgi:hypothetical protein